MTGSERQQRTLSLLREEGGDKIGCYLDALAMGHLRKVIRRLGFREGERGAIKAAVTHALETAAKGR